MAVAIGAAGVVACTVLTGGSATAASQAGGLAVTDLNHGVTAQQLAASIVGGGVVISNVTYTGANNAAGSFSGGSGITGFDSGIVLGSGSVQTTSAAVSAPTSTGGGGDRPVPQSTATTGNKGVEGPNQYDSVSTSNYTPGDATLDTLSGKTTYDAAVLEFDFVPDATALQFRYVFSSDEYNEYTNSSFNDTFALLVNGANCALVPGTLATPVGVNTINGGNPLGANASRPDLFLNNDLNDGGPFFYTEMDGLTVTLQCTAAVTPGQTNHLKLAIADATDHAWDSNVFIAGGSVVASGHSIEGHIWAGSPGNPVAGAFVQACPTPADIGCRIDESTPDGAYSLDNLPDHTSGGGAVDHTWNLVVNPPGGSDLSSGAAGPITVNGSDVENQDVTLTVPGAMPAGSSLTTPGGGTQTTGTPTTYWGDPMTLTVNACAGGTGSATLHVDADGYTQTLGLAEGPAGTYTATFAAPYPHHGSASFSWTLSCGTTGAFDIYIDPSGVVKTVGGNPIGAATVTLYRSDDPGGPFVQVPNGSAVMSPGNQDNPDLTEANGHFGWDVIAGYYKVRAEKNGCTAAGGTPAYVESGVLTIPPPVTNLDLRLDCGTEDVTAPDTEIQTQPANPNKLTTATFTFIADEAATFQCRLDGGPFAVCTSPKSYTGLAKRSHLFEVRAIDLASNVDPTPATYGWTNGSIPKTKFAVKPAALVNTTMTFVFGATDPGATFQCSLDSAPFAPCTSPMGYVGLPDGKHVFAVKAIDAALRAGKPISAKFAIDTTPPDTIILTHPTDPTTSTTAGFKFTATEAKSTFECQFDFVVVWSPCKNAMTYKGLKPGYHELWVRATDSAHNPDPTPAIFGWIVN